MTPLSKSAVETATEEMAYLNETIAPVGSSVAATEASISFGEDTLILAWDELGI